MTSRTVVVWMLTHEQDRSPSSDDWGEVFRFAWDPTHPLPRKGETIVVDEIPLIVRHVEWDDRGPPGSGLTPTIEVLWRPDHPALRADEDQDENPE